VSRPEGVSRESVRVMVGLLEMWAHGRRGDAQRPPVGGRWEGCAGV